MWMPSLHVVARRGERHHVERRLGHVGVGMLVGLGPAREHALHRGDVDDVLVARAAQHQRLELAHRMNGATALTSWTSSISAVSTSARASRQLFGGAGRPAAGPRRTRPAGKSSRRLWRRPRRRRPATARPKRRCRCRPGALPATRPVLSQPGPGEAVLSRAAFRASCPPAGRGSRGSSERAATRPPAGARRTPPAAARSGRRC